MWALYFTADFSKILDAQINLLAAIIQMPKPSDACNNLKVEQ